MSSTWRNHRMLVPPFFKSDEERVRIPATRFFDQMYVVGDEVCACFILDTADGYVLIDCLETDERSEKIIEQGFKDLGFDMNDLKAIVVTHGHGDHYGNADHFKEKYGTKIYFGAVDYELAKNPPAGMPFRPATFEVDHFIEDGEVLSFGETNIRCILTPGHTDGCFSFIIDVTDEGEAHKMALWGGSGIIPGSDPFVYYASLRRFTEICDAEGVDGEISTHPCLDNGVERFAVVRNIVDGVRNPFVLGRDNYHYYESQFYELAYQHGVPKP